MGISSTLHAFGIASLTLVIEVEVLGRAFGTEALVVITFNTVRDLARGTLVIGGLEHASLALCAGLRAGALIAAVRALRALGIVGARGDGPLGLALNTLVGI